ncbi:MAG: hypothetical protein C5B57_09985 [Blastocatellia bacterium]|nr:MAG: hypothetical protein C5B57_09985 [Blastocatellia bacterium]
MPFGNSLMRDWPENRLLREPLDAGVGAPRETAAPGSGGSRRRSRDPRRTQPYARGFSSVACVAALARFAFAA